jgi:hypothetical protein
MSAQMSTLIVPVRIVRLIEVELHGRVPHLRGGRRGLGELLRPRQLRLVQRRVDIDADAVPELSAEQLVHRHVQGLAGQVPEGRFHGRQHRNEHTGLRAPEDAALADLFEEPMDVERTLPANALPEALCQVVGPLDGIDGLATAGDPLVGVNPHEHAAAHIGALQVRDPQRGRTRGLIGAVDRLAKRRKRMRGGGPRHGTGRQERAPIVGLPGRHAPSFTSTRR